MIVRAPQPILDRVCDPVCLYTGQKTAALLRAATSWQAERGDGRGVRGLAAPQVGEPHRVFILAGFPSAFINPTVARVSDDTAADYEGCLSLPANVLVHVRRATWLKLRYLDEEGQEKTAKLHGTDARAALHEIDHLDGILITAYAESTTTDSNRAAGLEAVPTHKERDQSVA